MIKPTVTLRTAQCAQLMSQCVNGAITPSDMRALLGLLGDTLSSYLSRDEVVHIERLGTFYRNERGWIRFSPSRRMKERTDLLTRKRK